MASRVSSSTIAAAETRLAEVDPIMRRLIAHYRPCTLGLTHRDPFHTLGYSIISQQLSTKAADTIYQRVAARVGTKSRMRPAHFLEIAAEELRACGLSYAKAKWLRTLAQAVDSGELNFAALRKMDDAAALAALDALPGIGQWTAEMALIFAFDRLDIFSLGDVGLRRMVNRLYNKGRPLNDKRTIKLTAGWAPYRSVASWYLWRATDGDAAVWA
ncbi:MAG: DNA-3-methyladenine glycosylase family protein [Nevskiales bacterium]